MTVQKVSPVFPEVLWLSASPSFRRLEQPLLNCLCRDRVVRHWGYVQTPDEPSSLEVAITLLHDYLKMGDRPLHLVGHSTGGLIGLLYARQYPQRVKSLTLLGVGVNPAIDWKAHYYTQLTLLPCSRTRTLTQMVYSLFGPQRQHRLNGFIDILERDLMESLSLHSLMKRCSLFPGSVPVPTMVGGGQADVIIDPNQLQGWQPWLKPGDRLWICPEGRHFFYATHPQVTADALSDFWSTWELDELPAITA